MEEKQVQAQAEINEVMNKVGIKQCLDFSVVKPSGVYGVHIPMGAPLGEAFDAIFLVLERIKQLQAEAMERAIAANKPVEEKQGE